MKRLLALLASVLRAYFSPAIVGGVPALSPSGAIVDAGTLVPFLAASNRLSSGVDPRINYSAVTNASTTALTLSAANCTGGIVNSLIVASGGSANTNTTQTANLLLSTFWPAAYVGATAQMLVVNLNSGTMTLAGGTNVTGSGTLTIPTLAARWLILTVTNMANPSALGSVATNSTTTTAAVATTTATGAAGVIPVASSTGILVGGYLKWVNSDGSTSQSQVTGISSLNITVADPISKAVASGAAVSVHNNVVTMVSVCSTVTAIMAA